VEEGGVFLVGLDGGLVIVEARETAVERATSSRGPPGGLRLRESRFRPAAAAAAAATGISASRRELGEPAARRLGCTVGDQDHERGERRKHHASV
jgi:hypothetical protein